MLESLNLWLITNPVFGASGGVIRWIESIGNTIGEGGKAITFTIGMILLVASAIFAGIGILAQRQRNKLWWALGCFFVGGAFAAPKGWELIKGAGTKTGSETFQEAFGS